MSLGRRSDRGAALKAALWAVACLGSLLVVRAGAEGTGDPGGPWYQDLCSYKWEAIDQDNNQDQISARDKDPSLPAGDREELHV